MDLRTRYTALVTSMIQYIKFAGDSLKRLEEEEVGHTLAGNGAKRIARQTALYRLELFTKLATDMKVIESESDFHSIKRLKFLKYCTLYRNVGA